MVNAYNVTAYDQIVERLVSEDNIDINYSGGQWGFSAAHRLLHEKHVNCVRILAATGKVNWNQTDEAGRTALYMALSHGSHWIVDILVKEPHDYSIGTEGTVQSRKRFEKIQPIFFKLLASF